MKLGLRLVAFWLFSLALGGVFASISAFDGLNDVSYASAIAR